MKLFTVFLNMDNKYPSRTYLIALTKRKNMRLIPAKRMIGMASTMAPTAQVKMATHGKMPKGSGLSALVVVAGIAKRYSN